jgi:hypothetical protein
MASHRRLHIVERALGIVIDECRTAHHHAGCAEAALHRIVLDEGLLDGMERLAVRQSLDGGDLTASRIERQGHAARGYLAVEPHRARRARAPIASDLRAGEVEVVAQHLDERRAGIDVDAHVAAVDAKI